jgi:hypothetical protein
MAVYLFSYPKVLSNDLSLFPGHSQYDQFCKELRCLLENFKGDLSIYGFEPTKLGTHSTHKCVATAVYSGCSMSPPIVSDCICSGWTMGGGWQSITLNMKPLEIILLDTMCMPWPPFKRFCHLSTILGFSASDDGESHSSEEEVQLEQVLNYSWKNVSQITVTSGKLL